MLTSNTRLARPGILARDGAPDEQYVAALERLAQRAEELDHITCPQTWRISVHLLRCETADYLQTAPLPELLREALEHLYARIEYAERCGWPLPPALAPWQTMR